MNPEIIERYIHENVADVVGQMKDLTQIERRELMRDLTEIAIARIQANAEIQGLLIETNGVILRHFVNLLPQILVVNEDGYGVHRFFSWGTRGKRKQLSEFATERNIGAVSRLLDRNTLSMAQHHRAMGPESKIAIHALSRQLRDMQPLPSSIDELPALNGRLRR